MKHTPTPWQLGNDEYGRPVFIKGTANGNFQRICKTLSTPKTKTAEQRIANAEHIVKCVNEHEALKAENERLRGLLKDAVYVWDNAKPFPQYEAELDDWNSAVGFKRDFIKRAKQALESEV